MKYQKLRVFIARLAMITALLMALTLSVCIFPTARSYVSWPLTSCYHLPGDEKYTTRTVQHFVSKAYRLD